MRRAQVTSRRRRRMVGAWGFGESPDLASVVLEVWQVDDSLHPFIRECFVRADLDAAGLDIVFGAVLSFGIRDLLIGTIV